MLIEMCPFVLFLISLEALQQRHEGIPLYQNPCFQLLIPIQPLFLSAQYSTLLLLEAETSSLPVGLSIVGSGMLP